jgi:hypothetical protein
MNAVERIRAKLSTCAAACRGFWRAESIVVAGGVGSYKVVLRRGVFVVVPKT